MVNRSFFLDTCDPGFVSSCRNQLRGIVGPKMFVGVTTNPKAVAANCKTQGSARETIERLAYEIAEFRGDTEGQLFIQLPGSKSSFEDCVRFIEHTYNWGRPHVKIGYKLPHFRTAELAPKLQPWNQLLNVTGVTDARTTIESMDQPVAYVSLLTGRMEERSINAQAHVLGARWTIEHPTVRGWTSSPHRNFVGLIAGSMRTTEQLAWSFQYLMIPTIGRSLWLEIEARNSWAVFNSSDQFFKPADLERIWYSDSRNLQIGEPEAQLSREFFEEMDGWSAESAAAKIWG